MHFIINVFSFFLIFGFFACFLTIFFYLHTFFWIKSLLNQLVVAQFEINELYFGGAGQRARTLALSGPLSKQQIELLIIKRLGTKRGNP